MRRVILAVTGNVGNTVYGPVRVRLVVQASKIAETLSARSALDNGI
jgi:hypothetical protein